MIRAYSEVYLNSAAQNLADAIDYMCYELNMNVSEIEKYLVSSKEIEEFQRGNPHFLVGMSGVELARKIMEHVDKEAILIDYPYKFEKSPEYWAGWALAQYQWYSAKAFRDILDRVPLAMIVEMYPVYHEMDIEHFYEDMCYLYKNNRTESRLKRMREKRGLSQSQLSRSAGVNIRNIQMYEQNIEKIDSASCRVVYKLAYILGCNMEDLLEEPLNQQEIK